jgi:hypothetical protein
MPNIYIGSCMVDNGSAAIGSKLFGWAAIAVSGGQGQVTVLSFPNTTCRQLTLKYGFNSRSGNVDPGLRITVMVLQTSEPLSQSSAKYDQLRSMTIPLDGGPWQIQMTANQPGGGTHVYINGSAVCSTSTGE